MKKSFFTLLFFTLLFSSEAQYRRKYSTNDLQCPSKQNTFYLKKEVGLAVATPWRFLSTVLDNAGGGVYIHPRIEINNLFSVGIRTEIVVMRRFYSEVNTTLSNYDGPPIPAGIQTGKPSPVISLALTTDIKIPIRFPLKPFFGGGLGYYYINSAKLNVAGTTVKVPLSGAMGLNSYIGLEFQQFRASANLHLLRENKSAMTNLDYLGLNLGYMIEKRKKYGRRRY